MKIINGELLWNKWLTVVVITADWDEPGKELVKYTKERIISLKKYKNVDIKLLTIDVDKNKDLVKFYWFNSVPYTVFFKNKNIIEWFNVLWDGKNVIVNLETIIEKNLYK